jgi:hypothetical protein
MDECSVPATEKRWLKLVWLFRVGVGLYVDAGVAGPMRELPSRYRHTGMWRRFHSLSGC